ncbi:uncharacterized protein BCR38DRAFT_410594 [Pseudomassariella vexata]|uniref:Uncharacterized protein n=1 Tax=Pseudomassariella vexata TaxID=1141098 RepID=A0A1Y2DSM1_9PEZI|nr:uncharacterized protein BCR38DRAFT_410594 [Pseudomassariella vexata]ORY62149.1 hypothetical protein BCR38DRAFT_410594 [Pseudomassariella vexata]
MEAIQLAQMLADLNDLQVAQDQGAAKALVSANKNLDAKLVPQSQPQSKGLSESRTASPATRFDKLGRRIFTPPLSRTNSGTGTTASSIPGTPRTHREDSDADIDRASTLLSLYEIRAKLKEQDNSSLMKAREKINALAAKQAQTSKDQKHLAPPKKDGPGRITYPK